jgi:2-polyprenyl-3-methyl-5-hydroxy-6-metoxy-1,4-benzoquinol methylase
MDFSVRSYQKELLDRDNNSYDDILRNMKELDVINTWLGGHSITLSAFKQLAAKKNRISVCEIGCGGGGNLYAIQQWCRKNGIEVSLTGIDLNEYCISIAAQKLKEPGTRFITSDFKKVQFEEEKPDIIFSSLFCHHFTEPELAEMLLWMRKNAGIGFFINDLHRHALAYYSIKLLTSVFSKSYLVKHDAPLSVRRGFSRSDWLYIFRLAGMPLPSITWKWAFRWLIIYRGNMQKTATL